MDETINTEFLPDVAELSTAGEGVSGENASDLSLSELNSVLGKQFPSKDAALKAVKDTFGYVGKVGQLEKQVSELRGKLETTKAPEFEAKLSELERTVKVDKFYSQHPEYKDYDKLISSMGSDPAQVVESEVFKSAFQKLQAADAIEKSRSVLHSNPRLGQVSDKIQQAQNSLSEGNRSEAAKLAVEAVVDLIKD